MKKSELYHLINSLIQKSKQEKKNNPGKASHFVNNYCKQFLRRNKLVPQNRKQKMQDIMKGFSNLDSYVDLNDIVVSIQEHINKQFIKDQKQQYKNKQRIKQLKKIQTQPVEISSHPKAIQRAQYLIKKGYKQGLYLQLNKCSQVIQNLENDSRELNNAKYKNSSNYMTFHQLINKRYVEGHKKFTENTTQCPHQHQHQHENQEAAQLNEQHETKSVELKKSPWRILQQRNAKFGQVRKETRAKDQENSNITQDINDLNQGDKQNKPRNRFDHSKMLHSAAIYLHMILQREHQKKWAFSNITAYQTKQSKQASLRVQTMPNIKHHKNIRSTCTQQNSECIGLEKQNRDLSVQSYKNLDNCRQLFPKSLQKEAKRVLFTKQNNRKFILNQKSCKAIKQGSLDKAQEKKTHKTHHQIHQIENMKYCGNKIERCINKIYESKQKVLKCKNDQDEPEDRIKQLNTKKKPRHTLANPQNVCQIGSSIMKKKGQREYIEQMQQEKKKLREKFTFKKRKVKEGVLRKITQFVNDIEYAERNMIIQSKNCEKQLEKIQNKMQHQFQSFKTQKLLNDDKALQGVRNALSKVNSGCKRYEK